MKTSTSHFKNRNEIWITFVLIIFSTLVAFLAVRNIKISPDSMLYSLMSQEILSGNGLKVPVIKLFDNYTPVNGKIPYPEEAPLLPILFAILGGVTQQNFLPAQIINAISHVAISIFTFLIMKKIYDNKGIALLTGILVSTSLPLLHVTRHIWTEILFIAFTVAALYFLTLSRHHGDSRFTRNILAAGICASLAFLTRFPGIALIPVFLWEIFILIKNKDTKSKYVSATFAVMLPVITTAAIFIRNYIISGNIYGWNHPPFERSYLNAFIGTLNSLFQQFPLGKRSVTLITIFATLFMIYIILNRDARRELLKYIHSGLDLIILFTVSYTVVISLALAATQEVFEIRFMTPLVPFLFILSIFVIVFVWEMVRLKGFHKISLIGVILSLGIITFGNCYKTYLRSGEFFIKQEGFYSILKSSTYKWIKENYEENVIITTNKPYHLSFFGGYSTIRLPNRSFLTHERIPEDMELILPERMSKFGSRVLALFDEVDEQYQGNYIVRLFNKREDDENFVLIQKFPDGVIYSLKE